MVTNPKNESDFCKKEGDINEQTYHRRPVLKTLGAVSAAGMFSGVASGADESSVQTDESFDILETTVAEIQAAIATDRTTAREVTEQYLNRIRAYDDQLNAIITVNTDAVERAKKIDEEFKESGFIGPLHGIPILLKDNMDTCDLPTTGGNVLFEDTIPPDDAFLTRQLREAGGIILAKANLGEFAYGSLSSLGGQAHNPYDLDRSPGGSSAGSGVGTAANLGAISVGSDTGGSVRFPAGHNALVGIRPTTGLLSRDGIIPLSSTLDTAGPMTRTVADNAAMLDVMAGYDPADPKTAESTNNIPEEGYTSYLDSAGLDGARIGVFRQLIEDDADEVGVEAGEPKGVATVVESALSSMKDVGATIVDIEGLPDLLELASNGDVISYEIKREMNEYLDSLGEEVPVDSFTEIVESGTVEGVIAENTFPEAVEIDPNELDENIDYLNALLIRRDLREVLFTELAEHDLDAFVYPPTSRVAGLIDSNMPSGANTWIAPIAAFPSITVPAGFTEESGLPVGLEFMVQPFEEPLLIELAYSFEQATMHRRPPDRFGPLSEESA